MASEKLYLTMYLIILLNAPMVNVLGFFFFFLCQSRLRRHLNNITRLDAVCFVLNAQRRLYGSTRPVHNHRCATERVTKNDGRREKKTVCPPPRPATVYTLVSAEKSTHARTHAPEPPTHAPRSPTVGAAVDCWRHWNVVVPYFAISSLYYT